MAPLAARSPAEWFNEAVRLYVAAHQGCAACGGRHCVFRSEFADRVEYSCSACGFSACFERHTSCYLAATAEETEAECVG